MDQELVSSSAPTRLIIENGFNFVISLVALLLTYYFARKNKSPYKDPPKPLTFSGLMRRMAATIIDILIIFISMSLIAFPFFITIHRYFDVYSRPFITATIFFHFIGIILVGLYFAIQQSSKYQATFGMRLFGIKIYNADMKKANFWILLGRHLAMNNLFIFTLGIAGLMIIWTRRKQGLHDKLARTVVCRQWQNIT